MKCHLVGPFQSKTWTWGRTLSCKSDMVHTWRPVLPSHGLPVPSSQLPGTSSDSLSALSRTLGAQPEQLSTDRYTEDIKSETHRQRDKRGLHANHSGTAESGKICKFIWAMLRGQVDRVTSEAVTGERWAQTRIALWVKPESTSWTGNLHISVTQILI